MIRENENPAYNEDDFLHVGAVILDYLRFLKRSWKFLLPAMALCAAMAVVFGYRMYTPRYSATVYYSVDRSYNAAADASLASRVAASVSVISSSSDFEEELLDAMEAEKIPVRYGFYGSLMDSTNLFEVTVVSYEKDLTNELLAAFQQVYPTWVSRFSGCGIRTLPGEELSTGEPVNSWSPVSMIGLGAAGAAAVWFMVATVVVISIRKVYSVDDLYQVVDAECLGVLPDVVKKKRKESTKEELIISNQHINKPYLRAVRSLRSRVEQAAKDKQAKVVMVTSTMPQEGKTLIVTNLAMALAIREKKVLVVDADLHVSGFSRVFDSNQLHSGLSDYLSGTVRNVEQLIQEKNGLRFICAGKNSENGKEISDEKKMKALIDRLREEPVDLILIDTPPVGMVSDAVLYSEHVDLVFYVIRGDYAQIKEIRKGIEPFYQSKKLGGCILNRISDARAYRHYGYGYGYYAHSDESRPDAAD